MNSLYGRFGMKPEKDLDKLVSNDFVIPKKIIELKNEKILINYYDLNDELNMSNRN
jgi:hypothetical protein